MNIEFSEESELPELITRLEMLQKEHCDHTADLSYSCAHCMPVFSKLLGRAVYLQGMGSETFREVKVGRPGHGCSGNEGMAYSSAKRAPHSVFAACLGASNTFPHKQHSPARKQQPNCDTSSLPTGNELPK